MTKYRYAHTAHERHPYIKVGWYWKVFEGLYNSGNLREAYRKRMEELRDKDQRAAAKKWGA